jgi:hypothetical protein
MSMSAPKLLVVKRLLVCVMRKQRLWLGLVAVDHWIRVLSSDVLLRLEFHLK